MDDLKISVVIPVFNRAAVIGQCLDSITGQTYPPAEILVIDDGSTDATVETVQNCPDPRVRLIRQDCNRGAQAARNRGIREAKSDWIAFQDSDDRWFADKLQRQVRVLSSSAENHSVVVHGDYCRLQELTGERGIIRIATTEGNCYTTLLQRQGPMFQGMLTSRKALQEINYLDEAAISYQEWDTAIRLAKICTFIHITEPLFEYRLHGADAISKDPWRNIAGYHYIILKHRDDIIRHCGVAAFKQHLLFQYRKMLELEIHKTTSADSKEYTAILNMIFSYCSQELLRAFEPPFADCLQILLKKIKRKVLS
jgi:glycosyltransferase involved in cell wall biosynthesis